MKENAMSQEMLDRILNAVIDLRVDMDRKFERVDERFDGVEHRLDNIENRLYRVENRLDRVEQRLDRVEHRLSNVENELGYAKTDSLVKSMDSGRLRKKSICGVALHPSSLQRT